MNEFDVALVDPRKIVPLNVGYVQSVAAGQPTGQAIIRVNIPTGRIHWSIEVGWSPFVPGELTGTWALVPHMLATPASVPLQALVASGSDLPGSYEAESAERMVIAHLDFTLVSGAPTAASIQAIVTFEPARSLSMSGAERAYWFGRCSADVVQPVYLSASL